MEMVATVILEGSQRGGWEVPSETEMRGAEEPGWLGSSQLWRWRGESVSASIMRTSLRKCAALVDNEREGGNHHRGQRWQRWTQGCRTDS